MGRLWGFTVRNSPSAGSTLSGSIALSESVHLSELGFLIPTMEEVRVHIEPEPEAQRASKSQNESWIQALRVLKPVFFSLYRNKFNKVSIWAAITQYPRLCGLETTECVSPIQDQYTG